LPHLVVSISGHGFGHVAQTAPILNSLHERLPELHITVRSTVPLTHLRSRIRVPFTHLQSEGDIGMVMSSALDVDVEKSRASYQKFHTNWDNRVTKEAQLLRELKADLVFSNVGYLALAGAQLANIPNVALCSLNWADIYRHYCGDNAIVSQMHRYYANADAFFRATPGMAMSNLTNLISVDPIANIGTNRRNEINRKLNLPSDEKLVLVSMGGITSRLPIERWQHIEGIKWLVEQSWQVRHPDAFVLETLQMNFSDVLASCDALLCKPGYGSFVEAAGSGVPVAYINRPDWPEAPALVKWLQQHGACREVSQNILESHDIENIFSDLWNSIETKQVVSPTTTLVTDSLIQKLNATN
jgi:hypothetical protein